MGEELSSSSGSSNKVRNEVGWLKSQAGGIFMRRSERFKYRGRGINLFRFNFL